MKIDLLLILCTLLAIITAQEAQPIEIKDEDIDKEIQSDFESARGFIQGFKRGFYNSISLKIKPQCFGDESQEMGFHIYEILRHLKWGRLYEIPGYMYEIYLSAVVECQIEETIYDLAEYCDKDGCNAEKVFNNTIGAAFKIIGIMNAFAAVTYEKTVVRGDVRESKEAHFELWQEVGRNVGKLFRFTTDYHYESVWGDELEIEEGDKEKEK